MNRIWAQGDSRYAIWSRFFTYTLILSVVMAVIALVSWVLHPLFAHPGCSSMFCDDDGILTFFVIIIISYVLVYIPCISFGTAATAFKLLSDRSNFLRLIGTMVGFLLPFTQLLILGRLELLFLNVLGEPGDGIFFISFTTLVVAVPLIESLIALVLLHHGTDRNEIEKQQALHTPEESVV